MALNRKDLITLAKTVANANPSSQVAYSFGDEKFSYADLNETLREQCRKFLNSTDNSQKLKHTDREIVQYLHRELQQLLRDVQNSS